jgi:hypothetical protein
VTPTLAALLLSAALAGSGPIAAAEPTPTPRGDQRTETLRRFGLDPTSSLESRVRETPASVMEVFAEPRTPAPTPHVLTQAERRQLSAALDALPPLHRRLLSERLRTLSFLDGMPNTALTSTVNPDEDYRLFDITIRAGVLSQSVSEWLTDKERTCFDFAGSALEVSIEAGTLPALVYALIHEATHVVDSALRITPAPPARGQPAAATAAADASAFTRSVWADSTTLAARYRDPLLESVRFRSGGRVLPIGEARAVYEALSRTPFASLYGSRNWYDDLAEYVALYELTRKLDQPYRIVVRKGTEQVFVYEPMKSSRVLGRSDQLKDVGDSDPIL